MKENKYKKGIPRSKETKEMISYKHKHRNAFYERYSPYEKEIEKYIEKLEIARQKVEVSL